MLCDTSCSILFTPLLFFASIVLFCSRFSCILFFLLVFSHLTSHINSHLDTIIFNAAALPPYMMVPGSSSFLYPPLLFSLVPPSLLLFSTLLFYFFFFSPLHSTPVFSPLSSSLLLSSSLFCSPLPSISCPVQLWPDLGSYLIHDFPN